MGRLLIVTEIALISFTWMCDQIKPYVQLDNRERIQIAGEPFVFSTLANREIELRQNLIYRTRQAKNFGLFWPLRFLWRLLDKTGFYNAPATTHFDETDDAWATGRILEIFEILSVIPILHLFVLFLKHIPFLRSYRTPGEYKPLNAKEGVGKTNEHIHPSVAYRQAEHKTYRPEALNGFVRSKKNAKKHVYVWKKGDVVIPEYVIKRTDCISRHLAEHSRAKEFVNLLVEKGDKLKFGPQDD